MKKFIIVMTAFVALLFAVGATAAVASFTGWTTAKTETVLIARFHAPPSPTEIARLESDLQTAIADQEAAQREVSSYSIYECRTPSLPNYDACQAAIRRLRSAQARVEVIRQQISEAYQGQRAIDARCIGLGKRIRAHYRQLRCVVIFPSTRWTMLIFPRDGIRFSYRRVG